MTPRTPQCECFGPCCRALNIRESRKTPNLQLFQVLGFIPTLGQSGVATREVFEKLKQYKVLVENEIGHKIKVLRFEN